LLYLLIFFTSFLLAMVVSPWVISLSRDWGLIDHPDDGRKQHEFSVPMAGGPILFPFVLIGILFSFSVSGNMPYILAGACLIFGLGIWDDRFGAHFTTKFLIQVIAALLVMQSGLLLNLNKVVFFKEAGLEVSHFFCMALTVLWIVGITNAVNIIDGMDGLAAGLSFNAFAGIGALALMSGGTGLATFCVIMSGALLGFLRFNIHPARTFLGDSGSMLLGFTLAVLSLVQSTKTATFLVLVVPALLLALPMLDTAYAFARRGIRGQNPFKADREHLHHKLLDLNFTPRQVLGLFFSLSTGMGFLALRLVQKEQLHVLALAVSILVLSLAAVKVMQIFNFHTVVQKMNLRMRSLARRAVEKEPVGEERLWRNFAVLTGLCALNILLTIWSPQKSLSIIAGAAGLFAVGFVDVLMSRSQEEIRFETMHVVLFLSLVLNQVAILALWHRDYLVEPHFSASAFLALILLVFFIYRTGTFAAFLQDPMEILALFAGIVVCAIVKYHLEAPRTLPFAVILANALFLYIMLKVYLVGYRLRSLAHAFGFLVCAAVMISAPWWG
jgi:UDP-GlcNAc:undecaprenyl-phosphate GlcNAc-1-phosphate transferase